MQARLKQPSLYTSDFPSAMGEIHDLERPAWLHLTVALLLKNGLRNLEAALTDKDVPKVNWSNPWIRERNRYPWENRRPSEAALNAIQLLMVAHPKGPFDALGDSFASYTRIRVQEYLNRYAAHYGTAERVLLDRDLPERMLVNVVLQKIKAHEFYSRLSAPFSIGVPGEKEIESLLPDIRDEQHARELNRLREAFRPQIQYESASLAIFFHPTEIDPQAGQCIFSHEVGLILSDAERKKVRRKGASELWTRLNGMVNDLIRWAVQIPTDLSAFRDSLSPEIVAQVPFEKRDELRRDLNSIALTQAGHLRLTQTLARYSLEGSTVESGQSRGAIPNIHDEGKTAFREYIRCLERRRGLSDIFAGFVRDSEWAKSQTPQHLERLKKTLYRKRRWKNSRGILQEKCVWETLWDEAHSISKDKRPAKKKKRS